MKGLIDVEEYNKKVNEIESAKKLLDNGKPKFVEKVYVVGPKATYVRLQCDDDKKIKPSVYFKPAEWSQSSDVSISSLREIAACVIKLFGPITKEELEAVQIADNL